jgi:hypothetical protein
MLEERNSLTLDLPSEHLSLEQQVPFVTTDAYVDAHVYSLYCPVVVTILFIRNKNT